jgi:hypothetical protein
MNGIPTNCVGLERSLNRRQLDGISDLRLGAGQDFDEVSDEVLDKVFERRLVIHFFGGLFDLV